jgi:hypothetical protein
MAQVAQSKELKDTYDAILKLYDCAEDIISAIEAVGGKEMESALNIAEPVIEQLESTAEILTEAFIIYGETGKPMDNHSKNRAESSIRKLYIALGIFCESIGETFLGLKASISELAGDIRGQIIALQAKAKRKFGERADRLFTIMLWIGDYMKKLAHQLEKAGTGLSASLAIPGIMQLQPVTITGRNNSFSQTQEQQIRSWSL